MDKLTTTNAAYGQDSYDADVYRNSPYQCDATATVLQVVDKASITVSLRTELDPLQLPTEYASPQTLPARSKR